MKLFVPRLTHWLTKGNDTFFSQDKVILHSLFVLFTFGVQFIVKLLLN